MAALSPEKALISGVNLALSTRYLGPTRDDPLDYLDESRLKIMKAIVWQKKL